MCRPSLLSTRAQLTFSRSGKGSLAANYVARPESDGVDGERRTNLDVVPVAKR